MAEPPSPVNDFHIQGHRHHDGYYISKEQVNEYWIAKYHIRCPYLDPLPVEIYLSKRDKERAAAKKTITKRRHPATALLDVDLIPTTDEVNNAPKSTSSVVLGEPVKAAVRRAPNAQPLHKPKLPSPPRRKSASESQIKAEALVMKRLMEAITFSESQLARPKTSPAPRSSSSKSLLASLERQPSSKQRKAFSADSSRKLQQESTSTVLSTKSEMEGEKHVKDDATAPVKQHSASSQTQTDVTTEETHEHQPTKDEQQPPPQHQGEAVKLEDATLLVKQQSLSQREVDVTTERTDEERPEQEEEQPPPSLHQEEPVKPESVRRRSSGLLASLTSFFSKKSTSRDEASQNNEEKDSKRGNAETTTVRVDQAVEAEAADQSINQGQYVPDFKPAPVRAMLEPDNGADGDPAKGALDHAIPTISPQQKEVLEQGKPNGAGYDEDVPYDKDVVAVAQVQEEEKPQQQPAGSDDQVFDGGDEAKEAVVNGAIPTTTPQRQEVLHKEEESDVEANNDDADDENVAAAAQAREDEEEAQQQSQEEGQPEGRTNQVFDDDFGKKESGAQGGDPDSTTIPHQQEVLKKKKKEEEEVGADDDGYEDFANVEEVLAAAPAAEEEKPQQQSQEEGQAESSDEQAFEGEDEEEEEEERETQEEDPIPIVPTGETAKTQGQYEPDQALVSDLVANDGEEPDYNYTEESFEEEAELEKTQEAGNKEMSFAGSTPPYATPTNVEAAQNARALESSADTKRGPTDDRTYSLDFDADSSNGETTMPTIAAESQVEQQKQPQQSSSADEYEFDEFEEPDANPSPLAYASVSRTNNDAAEDNHMSKTFARSQELFSDILQKPALKHVDATPKAQQARDNDLSKSQRLMQDLGDFLEEQKLLITQEIPHGTTPLGRGRKAQVYTAEWNVNGIIKPVAIKEFSFDSSRQSSPPSAVIESFKSELEMLRRVNHSNIVCLYGAQIHPKLCIVTELLQQGSLHDCIRDSKAWSSVSLENKVTILEDILHGLLAMHSANMIHRDIKSHNILIQIDERGNHCAKVADLGSAVIVMPGDVAYEAIGTGGWTAPEILAGDTYDNKVDIFSYGMVIWEVLAGSAHNPYSSLDCDRLKMELETLKGLKVPEGVPFELVSVMQDCLKLDPSQRPTATEALRSLENPRSKLGEVLF